MVNADVSAPPCAPVKKQGVWRRYHFAYFLSLVWKKAAFVLIPLVLMLIFSQEGNSQQATGLVTQIALAAAVAAYAFAQWMHSGYAVRIGQLWQKKGVFVQRERRLNAQNISLVEEIRTPLFWLCRAVRLTLRTAAGGKDCELDILVPAHLASTLRRCIVPHAKRMHTIYKASVGAVAFMAASGSNFFAGLLIAAPFVNRLGTVLGSELPAYLYGGISESASVLLPFLPPVFAAFAGIMIIGYVVHFMHNFFSFGKFTCARSGESIIISRGIIRRKITSVNTARISSADTRATLLTALFGYAQTWLSIEGLSGHAALPVVPCAKGGERRRVLEGILPAPAAQYAAVFPEGGRRLVYWLYWLIALLFALICWLRMVIVFPAASTALALFMIPLCLLLLWRFVLGVVVSRKAGVVLRGDSVEVCCVHRLSMHTIRIMHGQVARLRITQSPIQRRSGLCNVCLRAKGGQFDAVCRNLPLERAVAVTDRIQ